MSCCITIGNIGTWLDGHWDGRGDFVPVRGVFAEKKLSSMTCMAMDAGVDEPTRR